MNKETMKGTVVATVATMATLKIAYTVFNKVKAVVIKAVKPKDVEGKLVDIGYKING